MKILTIMKICEDSTRDALIIGDHFFGIVMDLSIIEGDPQLSMQIIVGFSLTVKKYRCDHQWDEIFDLTTKKKEQTTS